MGMTPILNSPLKGDLNASVKLTRSSTSAMIVFERLTISKPTLVNCTRLLVRSTKVTPRTVSSSLIPEDSVD